MSWFSMALATHPSAEVAQASLEVILLDRVARQVAAQTCLRDLALLQRRTGSARVAYIFKLLDGPVELVQEPGYFRDFLVAGVGGSDAAY
jgi:hypothetical protein